MIAKALTEQTVSSAAGGEPPTLTLLSSNGWVAERAGISQRSGHVCGWRWLGTADEADCFLHRHLHHRSPLLVPWQEPSLQFDYSA